MARLVIYEEQEPLKIQCGEESKWLCRCGLSKKRPWCDGSHRRTRDEQPGKTYFYTEDGRREIPRP